MTKRWEKFKTNNATQVSIEKCQNVDDFLKACKKELFSKLGSYDVDQLSLSTTDGGSPLEPDDPIPAQNTAKTPLFINVSNGSALLVPTLWRSIIGDFVVGCIGLSCS